MDLGSRLNDAKIFKTTLLDITLKLNRDSVESRSIDNVIVVCNVVSTRLKDCLGLGYRRKVLRQQS